MAGGAASGFRRRRGQPAVARGCVACRAAGRSQRTRRRSTGAGGGGRDEQQHGGGGNAMNKRGNSWNV